MHKVSSLYKRHWWTFPIAVLALSLLASILILWPVRTNAWQMVAGGPPKFNCFENRATDFDCYRTYYQKLVKANGIKAGLDDLKARYATDSFVVSQCHQFTHVLGRSAAMLYPDVAQAYAHGDSFCWSGYYHGVMEQIATKLGYSGVKAKANDICASLEKARRYSFDHYNCVHGLGHGFMAIQNDELFESLKTCDTLTDSWNAQSCYGGVFMENIMSVSNIQGHATKYLKPDEPMYPCTAVATKYKLQCYQMQTSYALTVSNYDFPKVFGECDTGDVDFRSTCYQSIGRDASGNSISDVTRTTATCKLGTSDQAVRNCMIGAAKDFVSYFHRDTEGVALCNAFGDPYTEECKTTIIDYMKSF
jgi:hypothetical protein